jgi:serine/threonine protein kinase
MELPARIGKYELEVPGRRHVARVPASRHRHRPDRGRQDPHRSQLQDAEAKARFLPEARMAGNISHDNIISIYDFGEDETQHPFMVMEFLRGEVIRHAIKNGHTGDLRNRRECP